MRHPIGWPVLPAGGAGTPAVVIVVPMPEVPRKRSRPARLAWVVAFTLACLVLLGLVVLGAVTVVGWFR